MADPDHSGRSWTAYYRRYAGRQPRGLLLKAISCFAQPGTAIDLGSGGGIESIALLERGWHVLAVDSQLEAIRILRSNLPNQWKGRLTTRISSFEVVRLPPADLIWAGLSLPFCPPAVFPRLWEEIVGALKPGGWFAGDMFGDRHAWASRSSLTSHSRAEVERLLSGLEVQHLAEEETDATTVTDEVQRWHAYKILARKPA